MQPRLALGDDLRRVRERDAHGPAQSTARGERLDRQRVPRAVREARRIDRDLEALRRGAGAVRERTRPLLGDREEQETVPAPGRLDRERPRVVGVDRNDEGRGERIADGDRELGRRRAGEARERTPPGFLFAAKLPQEITHERGLVDCERPLAEFLEVMGRLGDKLGPVVAQFGYVARGADPEEHATGDDFRARLAAFLDLWPKERKLAVEVRNAGWIAPPLLDLLRARGVSLVVSAYYTMPGPEKLFAGPDPVTAGFVYARFIGDHKKMDALVAKLKTEGARTAEWNAAAVDRSAELSRWAKAIRAHASVPVLAYFNNHYAGFAPGTARLFRDLWERERG